MTLPVRRALRGLLALPLAATVALTGPTAALASSGHAPSSERQVTVMTRNLYLGADLTKLLTAPDPVTGVGQIVSTLNLTQPPVRMARIAAEITASDPDFVALQEVADWRLPVNAAYGLPTGYDFLALLQADLAAAGEPYDVVVTQTNFDSAAQLPATLAAYASFADRDVILVRRDAKVSQVKVLGTGVGRYAAQLTIPILSLGTTPPTVIDFRRGYEWADVQTRGKVWRIVNTHPEAYSPSDLGGTGPDVNGLQLGQLATALDGVTVPVVLLGDLNSRLGDPKRHGYAALLAAGFTDTWLALSKPDTAYTCCYNELLSGGSLDERIDHVLARGLVAPVSASHVGVAAFRTSPPPLWPSDHAGVVTTASIGKQ
jgi:endonuclease/exonuclease/phosphatase family metal-dependent hydrolase